MPRLKPFPAMPKQPVSSNATTARPGCIRSYPWPRALHSAPTVGTPLLAESASVPAPASGIHIREVQVNAVAGDAEGIGEQFADLLRKLPIHFSAEPADTADINESRITCLARHHHGRLAD